MREPCCEIFPPDRNRHAMPDDDPSWFVYLLALADYSAFKVGFSCNPLQRIFSFSRRYFECFDLRQSRLLRLGRPMARALSARI